MKKPMLPGLRLATRLTIKQYFQCTYKGDVDRRIMNIKIRFYSSPTEAVFSILPDPNIYKGLDNKKKFNI